MTDDSSRVIPAPEHHQFEIHVGHERAGLTRYTEDGGQRIFIHTEVDDGFSGRGLAGELVRAALDATRADGLRIVAVCPYVARFLQKNHDWDDIVDPVTPHTHQVVSGAPRH